MTLAAGTRLGPYEILAPLGAGGMGEVYRARDPRFQRDVAIKVLPSSLAADADRLRRFEQEARAAGALNHPNILAVYDLGTADGAPYVVSELLEGETLRSRIAGAPLPSRRALAYAQQIAQGLAAAHEKAIVHRDLKPENLFVTEDGRVKILDFGLAKLVQPEATGQQQTAIPTAAPATEPGVVMGTVGYMSPEQVKGQAADHRSDIFSFGTILYEMLSGRRAFRGDSAVETMSAILKEDPPDLVETNRNVAPALERLVRHCLEKSPAQRFQSARDLAYDVESLSDVSGTPTAALPALTSKSRRPLWLGLGALALAVVVAAAYFTGARREKGAAASGLTFRRLTFRKGIVLGGRFAPDGKTIVYSASWDGQPSDLFLTRIEGGESKSFGLPNSRVLSVSRSGSIAVNLRKDPVMNWYARGTLAELPLLGGSPRRILEEVTDGDWAPDGKALAVVRAEGASQVLEFPIGKKLDESSFYIVSPAVSPDGRYVAYGRGGAEQGEVVLFDLSSGKKSVLAKAEEPSVVWHPSGREVWYTENRAQSAGSVAAAVTPKGTRRTLWTSPDTVSLLDIARDGSLLVERRAVRKSIYLGRAGETEEKDVSWLDWGTPRSLSEDGSAILISEEGDGGGPKSTVFVRATDGSPAVRLSEGSAAGLSPDGKWAFVVLDRKLRLHPTGAGQAREIATGGVQPFFAEYFPGNDRRLRLVGKEDGKPISNYVLDLPDGKLRLLAEARQGVLSPDGTHIAVRTDKDEKVLILPVDGGERREVPGVQPGEWPNQWSADGKWLYVSRVDEPPPRHVYRLEISTGRRELWKALAPADRAGLFSVDSIRISRDGRFYVYAASRAVSSDLYVVEGLK